MSEAINPKESIHSCMPMESVKKVPRPAALFEHMSNKAAKKTMGPAQVELPCPCNYLKKHAKHAKAPEQSEDIHKTCTLTVRKPLVAAQICNPLMGNPTKRDVLQTTVVKPKPCVDTTKAHKQLLENAGLVPKYILKEELSCIFEQIIGGHEASYSFLQDYGQVPAYLQERREAEQLAKEEHEQLIREQCAMQKVSDEDQQTALEGLKKKWDELYKEYLVLPFILCTPSRRDYKLHLEEQMKQLEKHISLLETYKNIYISKSDACGNL
ncbi:enkurin-like [Anableps anableps]